MCVCMYACMLESWKRHTLQLIICLRDLTRATKTTPTVAISIRSFVFVKPDDGVNSEKVVLNESIKLCIYIWSL